jgi:hypothetical protein
MAKETTYAGMLGSWRRLLAAIEANAAELAHLETSRIKLEGLLTEAVGVNSRQGAMTASKQEASQRLLGLLNAGQRVTTVLRVSIREHYGPRSEKLAEFNLKPLRSRPRVVTPAPDEPVPEKPEPKEPEVASNRS